VPGSVQSVERAAAMLRLLAADGGPLGLVQIAEALGLARGTAHGLLRTLEEVGFVEHERPSGRYALAPDLLHLGYPDFDLNEIRSMAMNWADSLAARTGESVRVVAFAGGEAVVAHHVFRADPSRQVLETGSVLPLHASAPGKVLLAFVPGATRSLAGHDLDSLTYRTLTDRRLLERAVAEIRDRGWAAEVEEMTPGRAGIAAPVRDRGGNVVAAVGVVGAAEDVCDARARPRQALVTQVVRTGWRISREFGHGHHR